MLGVIDMKNFLILSILSIFSLSTSVAFASQSSLKWQPTSSADVLNKVNQQQSINCPESGLLNDPFVNSALSGYTNMMQGQTGGTFNPIEQQKMQADYARQQTQYDSED